MGFSVGRGFVIIRLEVGDVGSDRFIGELQLSIAGLASLLS